MKNFDLSPPRRGIISRVLFVLLMLAGTSQFSMADGHLKNVIFVTKSAEALDTLAIQAIDAHEDFSVTPYYPAGDAGVVTDDDLEALNAADVVVMGRNIGSGDVGAAMAAWDKVTAPVLSMNLWGMRSNRAMWIDNGGATNVTTPLDTVLQATLVGTDPVFEGLTGTIDYWNGPFSSFTPDGDDTDHGNGELLAQASDGTPLFVRWDADTEFYPGAGHTAAGIRTYIGNGNDQDTVVYFGFTSDAQTIFFNELARMAAIGRSLNTPAKEVIFVTKSAEALDTLAIQAIDAHPGFNVTPYYPAGDAGVVTSADVSALNAADVVVMGRNIGSGDVGAAMAAWDEVEAPVLSMNLWGMRSNRAMWIDNGGATNVTTPLDTVLQATLVGTDPVFDGLTGTIDYWNGPFSAFTPDGDDTDHGNGELLAQASDGTPLFVRWDAGVEFYPGAGHSAAGIRTYIGNGNDQDTVVYFGFTTDAETIFFNELGRMAEQGATRHTAGKKVVFVTKSAEALDTLAIQAIDANPGFDVVPYYPAGGAGLLTQAEVDSLHTLEPDVIIMGRNIGSGDVGAAMAEWDMLYAPVLSMNLWGMRSNRALWIDNGGATNVTEPRDTVLQATLVGTDPVFDGLTGTIDFWNGPFSAFTPDGDDTDHGNGELLAQASDGTPLFVRWDAETEFYPGAGHMANGVRTFLGNGNDQDSVVYFGFTDAGQTIFFNELARMADVEWELPQDTDGDGVPNHLDVCEGFDDNLDADGDGVPDGCDICADGDDNVDTDGDTVPDACDICADGDDSIDIDRDGIPDACDDDLGDKKAIAVVGNGNPPASYDQTLIDSLSQYATVHYFTAGDFNEASADSLYNTLDIVGVVIGESIGSGDVPNFGGARDAFPVPSISMEAGTYTSSWADDGFMTDPSAAIWGYGGANEEAVDLQWKIVDPIHESIIESGWQEDQIITWSDATPERGIPYLHGFATTVNVIAVAARESGGTVADPAYNADFIQDLAVAVAEFPIQQSFYMNVARAYHDTDPVTGVSKATQDFWDILRWSSHYMFDLDEGNGELSIDPLQQGNAFMVYPNPSVDHVINLSFIAKRSQMISIRMVDLAGKTVYTTEKMAKDGRNRIELGMPNVESGIYLIKTVVDGAEAKARVIVK